MAAPDDSQAEARATFHVRLLSPWTRLSPRASAPAAAASFFGLELELHGLDASTLAPVVVFPVDVDVALEAAAPSARPLASIVGPFRLVVRAKQTLEGLELSHELSRELSEAQTDVLQRVAAVQPGNTLVELDGERFLRASRSAEDVVAQLRRASLGASLARPLTLGLERHNLSQASAKIVPFAARADVQAAQRAQAERLQAQEAVRSASVQRKTQFLLQQLDYEREHYLDALVGRELLARHAAVMARGEWQAFEFERALWFFHAPSRALVAEHPVRSDPRARELLALAQLRVRVAVRRLQRVARTLLRLVALADRVVDDPRLVERVWTQSVWLPAWEALWAAELAPIAANKTETRTPRASGRSVDQEAERVLEAWRRARGCRLQAEATARAVELQDASVMTEPLAGPLGESPSPLEVERALEREKQTASTAVGSARACVVDAGTQSDALPRSSVDAGAQADVVARGESVEGAAQTETEAETCRCDAEMQTEGVEALAAADTTKVPSGGRSGESVGEWRSYLLVLKTNLVEKKRRRKKKKKASVRHQSTQTTAPAAPGARERASLARPESTRGHPHRELSSGVSTRSDSFSEYCRSLAFPCPWRGVDSEALDAGSAEDADVWRRSVHARQQQQQQQLVEERVALSEMDEALVMRRGGARLPAPATLRSAGADPIDRPDERFRRALDSLLAHDDSYDGLGEHTMEQRSSSAALLVTSPVRHGSSHGRRAGGGWNSSSLPQQAAPVRQAASPPIATSVPPVYLEMVKELAMDGRRQEISGSAMKLPYITRKPKRR